ncbi:tripartite ATP-independent periplasmic transporter solute receptor, DctP family [Clostridium aceticum]|uniref:Tripartite ATP-independent periplasmic transporter solute receptor, DctP family n=1 Tax=Clostridium aceticum TaxID=84022 RepID=A0A0D8IAK8_9CLOT|nr:TRAP transporter substrate-binding protein [Clostridium aceticum]AKL96509.1 tripartite ATP-independent periplasmic transporter solute receptor, DctP family [Clostridium aceticum]KJF27320.1 C4-dicarboxylate ABC transporter substrate-binding protein [Clostridium aceticum]
MKRKMIFLLVMVITVTLFVAGCGSSTNQSTGNNTDNNAGGASEEASITLKLGFSTNEEDPRAIAAKQFKEEVERNTNGSVEVQIYPSGQLGGDAALIEAMALDSGTVDIIITDASNFATYEPKMGISALPFQFASFEDAWKFMDSEIQAEVEELLLNHNMRVLAHYDNGFRCVTTSRIAIESPSDMKNLLIRTPENPVIMETMKSLGANPQPLAFSELYIALQQGTYDAQENPIPVIYNNKLYEVQSNLSITNHIYSGMCFTISDSTWSKMSDSQKAIVQEAATKSQAYNRELNKRQTEELLTKLSDAGMTIIEPDLTPFVEETKSVGENLKSLYGDLIDRVAEWQSNN